jgi:collagen type VII alpha
VALRRRRTFVLVAVGVFGAGVGGAVLVSAATTSGTITGCVTSQGALRVHSDPTGFSGSACNSVFGEHPVTINAAGVPGPAGPQGAQGPTGPTGSAGASGSGGSGGGTTTTPVKVPPTNFIAMTSFAMPGRHLVEAELDCPKGDVAQGGTAAMISPLGESPALSNAGAGPGITSPIGHAAVGWIGEATNSSTQAASLKLSVICTGSDLNAANVTKRLILSRKLRTTKAK